MRRDPPPIKLGPVGYGLLLLAGLGIWAAWIWGTTQAYHAILEEPEVRVLPEDSFAGEDEGEGDAEEDPETMIARVEKALESEKEERTKSLIRDASERLRRQAAPPPTSSAAP